jgi:MFS family permease
MSISFLFCLEGTLLYPFIRETLKMGDKSDFVWGALLTGSSIGSMIGSILLGFLTVKYSNRFKLFLNLLLFDGILFVVFSINTSFYLSMIIYIFMGIICAAPTIILNTILQETVDDFNRGKIISFFCMLSTPMAIVSVFVGTAAAKLITAQGVFFVFALLRIATSVFIRFSRIYQDINQPLAESMPTLDGAALDRVS